MKLLSSVDTEGRFFWIQSQFMGRHKHRNIKSCDEIVYARLCKKSHPLIIVKNWPTIPADEIETELILSAWGYQINHRNHFNFETGEQFSVQKRNPITSKVTAPLLIIGVLTLEQRISVGLSRDLSKKEYIIDTGESYTSEVIDYSEIEKAIADVGEARAEAERRKKKKFLQEFKLYSLDGGISAVMDFGATEEFRKNDIPKYFMTLKSFEIKGRHKNGIKTFRHILLNTEVVKEKVRIGNAVHIIIPEQYKGAVIGKGGETIKISSEKLRHYISLH